jgi:hypothetical protein
MEIGALMRHLAGVAYSPTISSTTPSIPGEVKPDDEKRRWWARQDLNPQPNRYERSALTN